MNYKKLFFIINFLSLILITSAQKKAAFISGKILDENENTIPHVSITILGQKEGITSGDSGTFKMKVPANKAFAIIFTHAGFKTEQRNFILNEGENEMIVVRMEKGTRQLQEVVVTADRKQREESGLMVVNPKNIINIPSPVGGVESLIQVFVGGNNELTSNYSVRGGNYDENLIYVNDFEIFRPYLVKSGQQEGLSFINPELTRTINFYNGGFQARYGDKMSSVLDIQYKKPKRFGGSAYISLLEQGFHVEGTDKKNKFTYLLGVRNRSNQNLLSSQETKGSYIPSSSDFQSLITYQFTEKWSAELLVNLSRTKFSLIPEYSSQTASVFSPYYTSNLGLDTYFEGREADEYKTNMVGLSVVQQPRNNLRLKWMASYFNDNEKETADITGSYLFGERSFDKTQSDYGQIINPLGTGSYQQYTRDKLNIDVWNFSHKGTLRKNKNFWQWGVSAEKQTVHDKLHEWERQDSVGYSLPYNPSQLNMSSYVHSNADLNIGRFSAYIQDNISFHDSAGFTLQAGARINYNTLNNEFLLSPRVGFSFTPKRWKNDIIFRGSAGLYQQPPFYREMRRYDGTLNTDLKSQKSWQVTAGMDYNFIGLNSRALRFTAEAYYKSMWDVVPYDIDNVSLRYYGQNNTKAYATGIELRMFGDLVKDAESWVSLGFMRTRENIEGDYYYDYKLDSLNNPVDSTLQEGGWFRRPTDRLITFGLFFQDYLSTNKNFKVYLNTLYGTNLPYNVPGSVKYRNALTLEPYIRVDIGFSALLLDNDRSKRRSHSPFKNFENIWATLEVFNLIDRDNVISYKFIKDYSNTTFAIPNRLTPRLLNLKIVARW